MLVGLAVAGILLAMDRPPICPCGTIKLWHGNVQSSENSQHLADWYSFSHIIHGFLFFWLTRWLVPRLPLTTRLLVCMGIEIGWEIAENSPFVINAYRQQALAAGYTGDSIINSVSDVVMMATGFFIASRVKARYVIALALAFEIFTMSMIRDGLALNVLNFAFPIQAIHDWQAGAGVKAPTP